MRIRLLQLDGSLPNVALMRIAAHHRLRGDAVELRRASTPEAVRPLLWERFDKTYASLIFEKSRSVAEELLRYSPEAVIGGTGWSVDSALERMGIDNVEQDYSVYPLFRKSIGFLSRGCRLKCGFCVVPRKEGGIRSEQSVGELWRGDPYPKELLLLDNDFFGQPDWRTKIKEMSDGGFKVSFTQGINVRALTKEAAVALGGVDCRDDSMKVRRIYTAWDSAGDESALFRGLKWLVEAGFKPDQIMVYMLIGYATGETSRDREYRRAKLRDFGARPYPMPFVRTKELVGFQRFVVGAYDKRFTWEEWERADFRPERLGVIAKGEQAPEEAEVTWADRTVTTLPEVWPNEVTK